MRELIYAAVGVALGAIIFTPFALLGMGRVLLQIREELEALRVGDTKARDDKYDTRLWGCVEERKENA